MSTEPPFKKFIVFRYADYYPAGGLGDLQANFDTLDEAKKYDESEPYLENCEVVDRDTWITVWERA